MAKVVFRPQVWVNDYAVDVDPPGEAVFEVPDDLVRGMEAHSYESDTLREHENCPQWAKEWVGPFECDFVISDDGTS